ncbi:MAG TPA: radical SAM protein [Bacteroidales bacterium]|nr:radical SAM protein [Bacteroidales bacterium]HRZ48606.1 radical SAM protein [Bacteroidales bacterium]
MAGFLFDKVVFGPVHSRRLGRSLGVNLLPAEAKCCTFDCIYCECGWTNSSNLSGRKMPERAAVVDALEKKLKALKQQDALPDAITFAGNGEPTLHPDFPAIIHDTLALRNRYAPSAFVTVLSNGTGLGNPDVFEALRKIDLNIQKLDAGTQLALNLINRPNRNVSTERLVQQLAAFNGKVIIQTLFLRGTVEGVPVDNTTESEVLAWIENLKKIAPAYVMVYPIDRETPAAGLEKIDPETLRAIAARAAATGIDVRVYP